VNISKSTASVNRDADLERFDGHCCEMKSREALN
jgi:hypothetical protein